MADDILVILDICLQRMRSGETLEQCLADFPEIRPQLETMLQTVQTLQNLKHITPSAEFRRDSEARLLSRIRSESDSKKQGRNKHVERRDFRNGFVFRTLVPVTLVALIALIVWAVLPLFSPSEVLARTFTLSLLSGEAEVKAAGSSGWTKGSDGMILATGSSVKTAFNSAAVLTFFDGSTAKLEPGAEVLVSRSEYNGPGSTYYIEMEQATGKTWYYVLVGGEEKPQFTVQTPHGRVVAKGTAFSAIVESPGRTRFVVMEGAVQIMEGERKIILDAGQQILVGDQIALSTPQPAPPAKQEFIVSTGLQGIGSVRDPSGAATGCFPDGLSFNQITGSKSVLSPEGQQILVEEPVSGEYILAVRDLSGEAVPVNVQVKQEGKIVFQYAETLPVSAEEGWLIRIKLEEHDNATMVAKVVSIEPLSGKSPENVVEPDLVKGRVSPVLPTVVLTTPKPVEETTTKPVPTVTPAHEIISTTAAGSVKTADSVNPLVQVTPAAIETTSTGQKNATATPVSPAATTIQPDKTKSTSTADSIGSTVATDTSATISAETASTVNRDTKETAVTPVTNKPEPEKTSTVDMETSSTVETPANIPAEPSLTPSTGTGGVSDTSANTSTSANGDSKSNTSTSQTVKTDSSATSSVRR